MQCNDCTVCCGLQDALLQSESPASYTMQALLIPMRTFDAPFVGAPQCTPWTRHIVCDMDNGYPNLAKNVSCVARVHFGSNLSSIHPVRVYFLSHSPANPCTSSPNVAATHPSLRVSALHPPA